MKKTIVDLINTFKLTKGLLRDNPEIVDRIEDLLLKAGDPDELDFENMGLGGDDENEDNQGEDFDEGFQYFDEDNQDENFNDDDMQQPTMDQDIEAPVDSAEKGPAQKVSASGYRDWQPKDKYEDDKQKSIDGYLENGYSHREAEAMSNAHDIHPDGFQSRIKASEPSDKFLSELKSIAGPWLKGMAEHKAKNASQEDNPELHGTGKILEAKDSAKAHKAALRDFMKSPELEGLSRVDRRKAITEFKTKYESENPNHRKEAIRAVGKAGNAFKEARETRKNSVQNRLDDIMESLKASGDTDSMGSQEAAQHVGGAKDEAGYSTNIERDPLAVFAENNPNFMQHHENIKNNASPEAQARIKQLNTAKGGAPIKPPKIEGEE